MQKGKIFFNIIIAISIIGLVSLIGYCIYYNINKQVILQEAENAVELFEKKVIVADITNNAQSNIQEQNIEENEEEQETSNTRVKYMGYNMVGAIQIPKTNVKAPILNELNPNALSAAVVILYGPGLNRVGNTVLVAHNYRNGTFFSNNSKLKIGDKIYITDEDGDKLEYIIYNTYITSDIDFDYATRETNGKREISLSTCTTDPTQRLVIWAKES